MSAAPGAPAPYLAAEVASQPGCWAAAADHAAQLADRLPPQGARVAVLGCGTSSFVAQAYAVRREQHGYGETDAFTATELPAERRYDAVLLISRSGTTTEVCEVARALRGQLPTYAIVATPGTALTTLTDQVIELPELDEQSVVQTRFATATLALLRASVGDDLSAAIAQAQQILADTEPVRELVEAEQLTFLGTGWTIPLAHEAALKLRESTQAWTESYAAMEYRHGPISIAGPGRVTWVLGEVPEGLAAQVAATGARLEHRPVDPLADLVRVHRLCLARAAALGLDPDRPRHLTRSVVLDREPGRSDVAGSGRASSAANSSDAAKPVGG